MFFDLTYVVTYFFGMFYIKNFMTSFLGEPKTTKPIYYLSHLLYPIIICVFYFTINIPVLNLVGNLVAIIGISMNYNTTVLKRMLFSVFLYIFMLLTEVAVAFSTGYLGVSIFEKGTYSESFGLIAIAMILYLISLVCLKIKKTKKEGTVKLEEWIAVLLIPLFSLWLIIVLIESENMDKLRGVASIAVIFAINVIVFYLYEDLQISYKDRLTAVMFEKEKDFYFNQCRYMEASAESARRFRHDTRNHLFTIAEIIKKGNAEQAENYIYSIVDEKLYSDITFSDTGNIAIDSVINFKLNEARNNGIRIQSDISVPNNLLLNATDITTVVGNLIDNAIEASCILEEFKRELLVSIFYEKGRLFIEIKNTFNGDLIEKEGRLVTKKTDKCNHGYGLKNVEKAIEKYDGFVDWSCSDGWFTVTAMMYVKAKVTL